MRPRKLVDKAKVAFSQSRLVSPSSEAREFTTIVIEMPEILSKKACKSSSSTLLQSSLQKVLTDLAHRFRFAGPYPFSLIRLHYRMQFWGLCNTKQAAE